MQKIQTNLVNMKDEEIDLFEILQIIAKRKVIIFAVTILTTITASIYVWNAAPVFRGSALIEIGEIVDSYEVSKKTTNILDLDNVNNLKEIITQSTGLQATIPNGTTNIINLSMENTNPSEIKLKLEDAVNFIIARHQEKVKLYQNSNSKIRMTQIIGKIQISPNPIKPKKQLIIAVGFISGLMLGIFLAFFLEFIGARRNR